MEIQFRPVKSAVPLVDHIGHAERLRRLYERIRRKLPFFFASDAAFRSRGKLHKIGKSKLFVYFLNQPHYLLNLRNDLFSCHKNMGIILRESADPHQTMQLA